MKILGCGLPILKESNKQLRFLFLTFDSLFCHHDLRIDPYFLQCYRRLPRRCLTTHPPNVVSACFLRQLLLTDSTAGVSASSPIFVSLILDVVLSEIFNPKSTSNVDRHPWRAPNSSQSYLRFLGSSMFHLYVNPDGLFVHKEMRIEELLNVSHEGTDFSITRWHALYQGFNLNQVSFATEGLKDAQQPNMDLMGVSSKIQEKLGSSNDFPDDLHDDYCMSLRLLKLTWETSPKWMECLFLSNAIIKLITMKTLSCPRTNRADWSSTCSSSC
ncbi:uncharacterized protein LOC117132805 isoform X2 [Brassica rapa]|nr:uncharacterized protein LOC117132805 isoform X2 [Brassica rapa]